MSTRTVGLAILLPLVAVAQPPHPIPNGYDLPNGWRITPTGKAIHTEDLILNLTASKDERVVVALHSGFNPHRLLVIDNKTDEPVQRIPLHSSWLGMTWSNHGAKLYVRGNRHRNDVAPIYVFSYANGRLSDKPVHGPAVAFSDLPHREAAKFNYGRRAWQTIHQPNIIGNQRSTMNMQPGIITRPRNIAPRR